MSLYTAQGILTAISYHRQQLEKLDKHFLVTVDDPEDLAKFQTEMQAIQEHTEEIGLSLQHRARKAGRVTMVHDQPELPRG